MPVKYKIDILALLKEKGFSTYKLRKDRLLAENTIQQLRNNELVSWANIERLCALTHCQPGDLIEYQNELISDSDFFHRYNCEFSEQERKLYDLIADFSEEYFDDFRFDPHSIVSDFLKAQIQGQDGKWHDAFVSTPDILEYYYDHVIEQIEYRVVPLADGVAGQFDHFEKSITVIPSILESKHCKETVLHECIHMWEYVIDTLPKFYRDILFISLYNDLCRKIDAFDEKILSHTHIWRGDDITNQGGDHDILFFMKSLDLDLRCGYKLGTVCGYGRADLLEDKQAENKEDSTDDPQQPVNNG